MPPFTLLMPDEMQEALDRAVEAATFEFENAAKNPFDHGHGMLKGIDGRTKLAKAMKDHDRIDVKSDNYHGTVAHIDGISRFATAQRNAYDEFIEILQEEGINTRDMNVWIHKH